MHKKQKCNQLKKFGAHPKIRLKNFYICNLKYRQKNISKTMIRTNQRNSPCTVSLPLTTMMGGMCMYNRFRRV